MTEWVFQCPEGWQYLQQWGDGHALREAGGGLRVIVDCEEKADGHRWIHVSVSRKTYTPTHDDMARVKQAFLGNRYAYSIWPPKEMYVNIHSHCLHLWAREDGSRVLPEFSSEVEGFGLCI